MGIEFGRISGPLLARNLDRDGDDLAFETDLLYLSVVDPSTPLKTVGIGINTDAPNRPLTVNGTTRVSDLIVTTLLETTNRFSISTNRIQNLYNDNIYIQPDQLTDPSIELVKIGTRNYGTSTNYLNVSDKLIENISNNSNIIIQANGSGSVIFNTSKVDIDGELHATGNITWDGNIIFGNDALDNVGFSSDVDSNIIPNANDTYNLGSLTQQWNKIYSKEVVSDTSTYDTITINNVDLLLTQGSVIYVSVNGNDSYVGDHLHNTFRTIKHALSVATSSDTVVIFPGVYEEIFPLFVPAGVTVNGAGIRAVTVKPTIETNTNNAFLLNGETTISNLTVQDFYSGYAFSFAPEFTVTTRSPYVQNVSVITASGGPTQITVGPSPTGISLTSNSVTLSKTFYSPSLVDSLLGHTAVIDRYPAAPLFYTVVSIDTEPLSPTEWRMTVDTTFNPAGQLKPISFYPAANSIELVTNDIWDTTGNSVGEKWVAWYKTNLPVDFETTVQPGWTINVAGTLYIVDYIISDPVNTNMWRIYITTSLVAGVGIPIFSSPIKAGGGALVDGSLATSISREASMLFHSVTFIVPTATGITATNGSRVEWLNSFTYFAEKGIHLTQGTLGFASQGTRFGAEIRSIGSANVYGTYGAVADGADTLAYLIGHNFAYIGTGTDTTNDPKQVLQANEILELNNGHIYYESVDQVGDFRIGDIFYVNQETGAVVFNAQSISFSPTGSITLTGPTSSAYIDYSVVQVGNIQIHDNNIDSLIGPINLLASSGNTYLSTNVFVTGTVNVTADINVDGSLTIGNQASDVITIYPKLTQNILPDDVGGPFALGSDTKRWNTLYATLLDVDSATQITNNTLSTVSTDTNLTLRANGTGKIQISGTDVQVNNSLTIVGTTTINGATSLKNTVIRSETLMSTTTQVSQNLSGTSSPTGFFFYGWQVLNPGQTEPTFSVIQPGWTVVGQPTWVVSTVGDGVTNYDITITGGSFASGGTYSFTGDVLTYGPKTVTLTGNIGQTGNTYITGLFANNNMQITGTSYFAVPDIKIFNNEISVTAADNNLVFNANGTGGVIVDQRLKFKDNAISNVWASPTTNTQRSIIFDPNGTGNVEISSTKSLVLPIGNNTNRTIGVGEIRYNNTTDLIEGGAAAGLISFNGIYDSDRNTSIRAGATNNTLYFGINSVDMATVNSTALVSNIYQVDNIRISGNTINNSLNGNDLIFAPNGTGSTLLNDVGVSQNSIFTDVDTPLVLQSTGIGYVKFTGTSAIKIPLGDNASRAPTPAQGMIRYNTEQGYTEVYSGDPFIGDNGWIPAIGTSGEISAEDVEQILEVWTYILG
jgi:hypothetical protein